MSTFPTPTVYSGSDLYGYRCGDCLSRWTFPGRAYGRCACGGEAECIGRLLSGRVVVNGTPCDDRCTWATGPHCSCSCGGANHGTHAVVEKLGPVFLVKITPDAQAVADEYRSTLAETQTAVKAFEDECRADALATTGRSYLPHTAYSTVAEVRGLLYQARKRNSHAKRMAELTGALDAIAMYGEEV